MSLLRTSYRYAAYGIKPSFLVHDLARRYLHSSLRNSALMITYCELADDRATPLISGHSLTPRDCIRGTNLTAILDLAQIDERHQLFYIRSDVTCSRQLLTDCLGLEPNNVTQVSLRLMSITISKNGLGMFNVALST